MPGNLRFNLFFPLLPNDVRLFYEINGFDRLRLAVLKN